MFIGRMVICSDIYVLWTFHWPRSAMIDRFWILVLNIENSSRNWNSQQLLQSVQKMRRSLWLNNNSLCFSNTLSRCLSCCLSRYLSFLLSVRLSVLLAICHAFCSLSVFLAICLTICHSCYLSHSISLLVCLSLSLFLFFFFFNLIVF